jgi:hypothetical protein
MLFQAFRLLPAAAAVAIFLSTSNAGAAPGDPAEFAREIYALPNHWLDIAADEESRAKYLAPSLAELVAKNESSEEFEPLDYDPLIDAQDFEITDLQFSVIEANGTTASVQVDFRNFGEAMSLTLELEANGDAWRLANIRYDAERSLSDDLEFMNEGE